MIECASLCLSTSNCGSIQTRAANDANDGVDCILIFSGINDALAESNILVEGDWDLYANQNVKGRICLC